VNQSSATRARTLLGLQIPSFTFSGVPPERMFERVADIARTAEAAGFDSIWVMDHLHQIRTVGPRTDPMLEGWTLLGGLAARTSSALLGTLVTGVTYRNPALVAKMATTLDVVSAGRAVLGIGAAWNEEEHLAYGYEFPPVRERMDRLEEALQICRSMLSAQESTFEGRHVRVAGALNVPQPVRPGGLPIMVGGSGERRLLPLVARHADMCNLFGDPDTIRHKVGVLDEACERAGRNPGAVWRTRLGALAMAPRQGDAERTARAMREARGYDDVRFRQTVVAGDPDAVAERVERFLDAGLDGMIFNMHDAHDLEPVELAGRTLRPLIEARARPAASDA
jgi:F420-dependent oxidoreductase-like protein